MPALTKFESEFKLVTVFFLYFGFVRQSNCRRSPICVLFPASPKEGWILNLVLCQAT